MSSTGVWQKALVYLGLWEEEEASAVYDDQRPPDLPDPDGERAEAPSPSNVRPLRLATPADAAGGPRRTTIVDVSRFEDCEQIGRHFRDGEPVLFDLAAVDRTTARRVIDFMSGMTFAQRGALEKVASRAFVLTPEGASLPDDERLRLEARGYRFADGA